MEEERDLMNIVGAEVFLKMYDVNPERLSHLDRSILVMYSNQAFEDSKWLPRRPYYFIRVKAV